MDTLGFYPGEGTQDPIPDMIVENNVAKSAEKISLDLYYQLIVKKNVNNVSYVIWPLENIRKSVINGVKKVSLVALLSV